MDAVLDPAAADSVIDRTFIRFVVTGVGNTVLGLAVIFGARQAVSDVLANLIGYCVVVPVSFLTHRNLTFEDKGRRVTAFARFLPTVLVGYAANYAVLSAALGAGMNAYIAQTLAISCHVILTYTLSRMFVFPRREDR